MGLDLRESLTCLLDLSQALDLCFHTRGPQRLACEIVNKTRPLPFYTPKQAMQIGMTLVSRTLAKFVAEARVRPQDESA